MKILVCGSQIGKGALLRLDAEGFELIQVVAVEDLHSKQEITGVWFDESSSFPKKQRKGKGEKARARSQRKYLCESA